MSARKSPVPTSKDRNTRQQRRKQMTYATDAGRCSCGEDPSLSRCLSDRDCNHSLRRQTSIDTAENLICHNLEAKQIYEKFRICKYLIQNKNKDSEWAIWSKASIHIEMVLLDELGARRRIGARVAPHAPVRFRDGVIRYLLRRMVRHSAL